MLSGLLRPNGITRQHAFSLLVLDPRLWQTKPKSAGTPIRDIDKSIEIFLEKSDWICFEVAPFVVVREAR
jgi:hypothetical protein